VPENWLSNYAYAVLDERGIARAANRRYTARLALLTVAAAFGGTASRRCRCCGCSRLHSLWAFHSVHHTQTQLTFLSANRIHAVEQLTAGVIMIVPAFVLGLPQKLWLPLLFAQLFSETAQHARVTWSFGALHRLFVSPAFHVIHHSTDEREYNGNYGRVFSLWDVLFGTFVHSERTSRRYGVEGMDVPERLTAQFLHPFRYLWTQR